MPTARSRKRSLHAITSTCGDAVRLRRYGSLTVPQPITPSRIGGTTALDVNTTSLWLRNRRGVRMEPRDVGQQLARVLVLGVPQDLVGGTVLHQLAVAHHQHAVAHVAGLADVVRDEQDGHAVALAHLAQRSEEHTSELQSRLHLVCRLL